MCSECSSCYSVKITHLKARNASYKTGLRGHRRGKWVFDWWNFGYGNGHSVLCVWKLSYFVWCLKLSALIITGRGSIALLHILTYKQCYFALMPLWIYISTYLQINLQCFVLTMCLNIAKTFIFQIFCHRYFDFKIYFLSILRIVFQSKLPCHLNLIYGIFVYLFA